MMLWKLERHDQLGYDEVEAVVVVARYERDARFFAAKVAKDEGALTWLSAGKVQATWIGTPVAPYDREGEIILVSRRDG